MNTKIPRERERKVQRAIMVRLLHRFGIILFRRNVMLAQTPDGRRYRVEAAGRSDLFGWEIRGQWRGRHWEIEVKAAGEKPTPKQLEWLRECHANGAISFWGDNVNDIERCAEAILQGGRVVWSEKEDFYIEMP